MILHIVVRGGRQHDLGTHLPKNGAHLRRQLRRIIHLNIVHETGMIRGPDQRGRVLGFLAPQGDDLIPVMLSRPT